MQTINFKIDTNQNIHKPILACDFKVKGKSSSNQLRPEACPAIYQEWLVMIASECQLMFSAMDTT